MENLGVFISETLFLSRASLREAKQSISYSICFFLIIIDLEVISREFLGQADLTSTKTFCIHEFSEDVMVNKDKDFVFTVF